LQPRDLIHAAYGELWANRGELLRVAAVPVIVTMALDALLFFSGPIDETAPDEPPGLWFVVLVVLSIPPSVLFAVNWLRVLVLGSASVPGLGLRWGAREMRFLLRGLVIGLAGLVATLVLTLPVALVLSLLAQVLVVFQYMATWLPVLTFGLVLFVYAYLTIGLSLALVAAAIDAPTGLRESWTATQGLRGRLVIAAIPVVGPFYLLLFLLPGLIASLGLAEAAPLSSLLLQVLCATVTSAAGFAFIAVVYRRLSGRSSAQLQRVE
jgi:hypothetical protein